MKSKLYNDLTDDLNLFFPGRGKEILNNELKILKLEDIDKIDADAKKLLANNILSKHGKFSHQRNRLVYQRLLDTLGLKTAFKSEEIDDTEEVEISRKDQIRTELLHFWKDLKKYYSEFEVILNIYWTKGIEAQLKGISDSEIKETIKKVLVANDINLNVAFVGLLNKLNIDSFYNEKKGFKKKFHFFTALQISRQMENKSDKFLYETLEAFWKEIDRTNNKLKKMFFTSYEDEMISRKNNKDEQSIITHTQQKMIELYNQLEMDYNKTLNKIVDSTRFEDENSPKSKG